MWEVFSDRGFWVFFFFEGIKVSGGVFFFVRLEELWNIDLGILFIVLFGSFM